MFIGHLASCNLRLCLQFARHGVRRFLDEAGVSFRYHRVPDKSLSWNGPATLVALKKIDGSVSISTAPAK